MKKKLAVLAAGCALVIIISGFQSTMLYGTEYMEVRAGYTFSVSATAEWWDCNWSYCKEIRIDHTKVQDDQTNFPVLLYEATDSDLAAHAQSDGDDIAFVHKYNTTQFKHEIEKFDSSTGELWAWVNVTSISSTKDTIFYMYYGNPTCSNQEDASGTWGPNYIMVQHLDESAGTIYDSTSFNNDGTNDGATFNSNSKIQGGYDFDGNDNITCNHDSSLNITGAITLEGWVKDPPWLKYNTKTELKIVDKRDEKRQIIPGEELLVERTISTNKEIELTFAALIPEGIEIKDIILKDVSILDSIYIANHPKSKHEEYIEEIRAKLPDNLKELQLIAYSEPFIINKEQTIKMIFETESNILSKNDKISYLLLSSDGVYDYEGSTYLTYSLESINRIDLFFNFYRFIGLLNGWNLEAHAKDNWISAYPVSLIQHTNEIKQSVEHTVPQTSKQAMNIVIKSSQHLDEDRRYLSDIFNEVYQLDDIWSETIPSGHFIRVTFEQPMDARRDITLFTRTVRGTPRIEVYESDGNEIIAEFKNLLSYDYNKVYLSGLKDYQDTFDLKILNGEIEIDYIVDPNYFNDTFTNMTYIENYNNMTHDGDGNFTVNSSGGPQWEIIFNETFTGAVDNNWEGDDEGDTHYDEYWYVSDTGDTADIAVDATNEGTLSPQPDPNALHMEDFDDAAQWVEARADSGLNYWNPSNLNWVDGYINFTYAWYVDNNEGIQFWTYNGSVAEVQWDDINTGGPNQEQEWTTYSWQLPQWVLDETVFAFRFELLGTGGADEVYVDEVTLDVEIDYPYQYDGNITSVNITKSPFEVTTPYKAYWDKFYVEVNNTANSTFSILDNTTGDVLFSGLNGDGDDISSLTNDSIKIIGYFNNSVRLGSWNVSWLLKWSNNNPVNSNPNPSNGSIDQILNPTLSIDVNDSDYTNQTVNVTFRTNASGSWADIGSNNSVNPTAGGVTLYQVPTNMNHYSTTYWWSVNTSDGEGGWDNDTYYFTTEPINTSVDTISPYNISTSPLSLSATGPSDLDEVTLYYRWSDDNVSWDHNGDTTYDTPVIDNTASETENTAATSMSWTHTVSSGLNNSILIVGVNLEDDDAGDNYYVSSADYNGNALSLAERVAADEGFAAISEIWYLLSPDEGSNTITVNFSVAINNAFGGSVSFSNVNQSIPDDTNINSDIGSPSSLSTGGTTVAPNSLINAVSTDGNSGFTYSYGSEETEIYNVDGTTHHGVGSYRIPSNIGSYTMYANLSGATNRMSQVVALWAPSSTVWGYGSDWIKWNNVNNPDENSPWGWNFDFPNGTGYYEFYSIGNKSGSPNETAPASADARCHFVALPVVITNTSTGVEETNATLKGYLSSDGDSDTTCGFRFGTNSGIYSENFSVGTITEDTEFSNNNGSLTPGQIYYYQAWASNYVGFANGSELTFLTKPNGPNNLQAQTNSSSKIYLSWNPGTGYNTTYIERNASGVTVWPRGNGIEIYNGSGNNYADDGLMEGVTYYYQAWTFANWTYNSITLFQWSDYNDTNSSTTNTRPTQSGESPVNQSENISKTPNLYIICSDVNEPDTLNATWWSNSSGTWIQFGSNNTSFPSGTNISQINSNFSEYTTKYWWSVNLTDGEGGWRNETYFFTTEVISTSVNTISPYTLSTNPLNITATGPSDLDNVTLYYRWSSDNSTWWNAAWSSRMKLTIDSSQVDDDLANFPILINITNSNLSNKAQTDGDDIVFTDSTGNKLNHEIENYTSGTGKLEAWVNLTNISSTSDTEIYIYYGNSLCGSQQNPTGVWDSNYVAVYHLTETSGTYYDSTVNDEDSTTELPDSRDNSGVVGKSPFFDQSTEYINFPDTINDGEFTAEFWFNPTWNGNDGAAHAFLDLTLDPIYFFLAKGTENNLEFYFESENDADVQINYDVSSAVTSGNWYYVVGVGEFNSNSHLMYLNGNQVGTSSVATNQKGTLSNSMRIGSEGDTYIVPQGPANAYIDEIRISQIRRNSSWITTNYNNMNNQSTFISSNDEEAWIKWSDASNPDKNSPWSWDFNFPNGSGYYEFYSIGNKSGSPNETAPSIADARCRYIEGTLPDVTTNTSTGIEETNATLWGWLKNNGYLDTECGFWWDTVSGGTSNNQSLGTISNNTEFSYNAQGLTPGQLYYFKAWANNSAGFNNSANEESFLTKPNVTISLTVQSNSSSIIYLTWTAGDGANTTYIERNTITNWARGSGTEVYNGSGTNYEDTGLTNSTTYYYQAWSYANWTNPTYFHFSDLNLSGSNTTKNKPEITNIYPANDSTGIPLNPTPSFQLNHKDGYQMNITWYWGTDSSTPNMFGKNNSVTNGTYEMPNTNFTTNAVTYYWRVTINDGHGEWTNETYHFTTIAGNKIVVSKTSNAYSLEISPTGTTLYGYINSNSVSASIDTEWHYVSLTYDGTNIRLYKDGELVDTTGYIGSINKNDNDLKIGSWLTGTLDEIRISNTTRNLAWINTTYQNTNSPTTFATFGSEIGILKTWTYRKKIWINASLIENDLPYFPVLIKTTDTDLKNNALTTGNDIIFTNSSVDWTTSSYTDRLPHEIELYEDSTGELIAWVNVTSLSSTTNTSIYMYYGNTLCTNNRENPHDVWDTDYKIVWHLKESGNGNIDEFKDSTANGINGTGGLDNNSGWSGDSAETPTQVSNGKIGYGQDFDDADGAMGDKISSKNLSSAWSAVTGSVWIYADSAGDDRIWGKTWGTGTTDNTINMRCTGTGAGTLGCRFRTDTSNTPGYDPASMENGEWIYLVLTWDGTNDDTVRIYKNGVLQGSGLVVSGSTLYGSPPFDFFTLGNVGDGVNNRGFDGIIDEARMSSVVRNTSWINTTYNNTNNTDIFLEFGPQETQNVAPILSSPSPSNEAIGISLNPTLSINVNDTNSDAMNVTFYTNVTGSWGLIGYNESVYNGTYSQTNDSMNSYNTKYWWSVNVTDYTTWTNVTYSFTISVLPEITGEIPANNSVGISTWPACNVTVSDADGGTVDVYFYENSTGPWVLQQTNSSVDVTSPANVIWSNFTNASQSSTKYNWSVHVYDGTGWTNETYSFTTAASPFLYIYKNYEFTKLSDFLPKATSSDKEYTQFIDITNKVDVINGKLMLKITEELEEITYLDRIYLRIDNSEIIELNNMKWADPIIENSTEHITALQKNKQLLQSSDNNYLVMKKGDQYLLEFFISNNYSKIEFVSEGFFIEY